MGRRDNSTDERVTVAISREMADLRVVQTTLNHFLWTTEIAYGYMLAEAPAAFANLDQPAVEVLRHITTEAWYPTNQGRIKFGETVGKILDQVTANTVHVYRAVLVFFSSAFENYLDRRLRHLCVNGQKRSWGPLYESLTYPELQQCTTPLRLRTVLCADICRLVRNRMVHPPFVVPISLSDPEVCRWQTSVTRRLRRTVWTSASDSIIKEAFHQVVGQAANHLKEARQKGKNLPIELFYMLFTFTNLDSLAFEIEEALIPADTILDGRGSRKREYVRRTDMIVD